MTPGELKALRNALGYSQRQAADAVEVAPRSYQRWEEGPNSVPGPAATSLRRHKALVDAGLEDRVPDPRPRGRPPRAPEQSGTAGP